MAPSRRGGSPHKPPPDHDVRLSQVREALAESLWFIPALMVAAAALLMVVLHQVDVRLEGDLPLTFRGDASSAQELLSTIASSTLTLTSLVFSITIVALQLASQQFSPRVMRTFFRDTGTKVCLGIFVSTFVYALLVLRGVRPEQQSLDPFVPALSVTMGFLLTLVALGAFVYYVNHVAHSIRAVSIMEAVAAETRAAIRAGHVGDEPGSGEPPDRPADVVIRSEQPPGCLVGLDEDDLVRLAAERRCLLRLVPCVGDYLPSNADLLEVWSDDPTSPPNLSAAEVVPYIGVAPERTMRQDVAFGFRQLVDMAERALSPGINDPTTAVQALDRLHDLLRRLAVADSPLTHHTDGEDRLRLIVPTQTWADYVGLAMDEIRLYGSGSLQVHRRLRGILEDLLAVVGSDEERRRPLLEQRARLDRATRRDFDDPDDQRNAGAPPS